MAFFQVAALDFDGTLTSEGQLSAEAIEAIDRVRRNGLLVVLVTGRIGAELAHDHPHIAEHVDALVLENGAVAVIDALGFKGIWKRVKDPRVVFDALAATKKRGEQEE